MLAAAPVLRGEPWAGMGLLGGGGRGAAARAIWVMPVQVQGDACLCVPSGGGHTRPLLVRYILGDACTHAGGGGGVTRVMRCQFGGARALWGRPPRVCKGRADPQQPAWRGAAPARHGVTPCAPRTAWGGGGV